MATNPVIELSEKAFDEVASKMAASGFSPRMANNMIDAGFALFKREKLDDVQKLEAEILATPGGKPSEDVAQARWHKLLGIVMFKMHKKELTISEGDVLSLMREFAPDNPFLLAMEQGDRLVLRLMPSRKVERHVRGLFEQGQNVTVVDAEGSHQ